MNAVCRCGGVGACKVCTDARAAAAVLGPWCECGHTLLAHLDAAGACLPMYCECASYREVPDA